MKKPILLFTAAVTGLALFQAPLQAQAAPNVSVMRISPGSGCQNSGQLSDQLSGQLSDQLYDQLSNQLSVPSDVNSLLDQLGITGCGNAGNSAGCNNAGRNNTDCDSNDCDNKQSGENNSAAQPGTQSNSDCSKNNNCQQSDSDCNQNNNCRQSNSDCNSQNNCRLYIGIGNNCLPVTPQTCQPETKTPETQKPDTVKTEVKTPEVQKPDTTKTEVKTPEVQKPDTTKTEVKTPEVQKPDTTKTEVKTPEVQKPGTTKTEAKTPEVQKPDTSKTDTTANYNEYVLRIVELVNEERAKAGLNPVTLREDVTAVAQVRAQETVTLFSHTRPDGRSCFTALSDAGVSYRSAGENIAYGQKSPEEVMNGWMNSSGHRANILSANYTTIGVGYYQSASGVKYWSQMFLG